MKPSSWDALVEDAVSIVAASVAELPPEIQAEAQKVPCLFQRRCLDDPDLLGIYQDFSPGEISEANGPIVLFLETIFEYCSAEGEDFKTEVRLTYLHELGHHFGWDEGDLEERGLG